MTKQDTFFSRIILDAIESDMDNGLPEDATKADKVAYAWDRFESEVGQWMTPRDGEPAALKHWFQGLALNVPYMDHEIIALGRESGLFYIYTEAEKERFLNYYWHRLGLTLKRLHCGRC